MGTDLLLFYLFAGVAVLASLAVVLGRNPMHSVLLLIVSFAALAGLYITLGSPFAAVIQIIIYAGAIMVLFLFAIMMFNLRAGQAPERKKFIYPAAIFLGILLCLELLFAVRRAFPPRAGDLAAAGDPAALGHLLFSKDLYPFEITSLLLIAALVGAMTLVGKKEGS